jgi:hypothetical protein
MFAAMKKKKLIKLLPYFALGCVLLAALGYFGYQALMRYFYDSYFKTSYLPEVVRIEDQRLPPPEVHLPDVPWISTDLQACQSDSMQMIAAQHGIRRPRGYFDFLMAFGYGASQIPGQNGMLFPGSADPEVGFRAAAPYLGLKPHYLITSNSQEYLSTLRYYLSTGSPVRVALDMGALYGVKKFIAHSEVLVGYTPDGFYYYETVCRSPASDALLSVACPGEKAPGEQGLFVKNDVLLQAVASQAKAFSYPWKYQLLVFEPTQKQTDMKTVWTNLAKAQLGGDQYGPKTGIVAWEDLAKQVERAGTRLDTASLGDTLQMAVRFRSDAAQFLRAEFAQKDQAVQAADQLDQAAASYQAAVNLLAVGPVSGEQAAQIAGMLRAAAQAERKAGELFTALSNS